MSGENCAGSFHIEIAAMRAANLVCEPERAQIASAFFSEVRQLPLASLLRPKIQFCR
jgi:hypothetical protein